MRLRPEVSISLPGAASWSVCATWKISEPLVWRQPRRIQRLSGSQINRIRQTTESSTRTRCSLSAPPPLPGARDHDRIYLHGNGDGNLDPDTSADQRWVCQLHHLPTCQTWAASKWVKKCLQAIGLP